MCRSRAGQWYTASSRRTRSQAVLAIVVVVGVFVIGKLVKSGGECCRKSFASSRVDLLAQAQPGGVARSHRPSLHTNQPTRFLTPPLPAAPLSGAYLAAKGPFLSLPQQLHPYAALLIGSASRQSRQSRKLSLLGALRSCTGTGDDC